MLGAIFRLLAAICLVCYCATASAAEIRISDHPLYSIILEGEIVPGDFDKLLGLINDNCPSKSRGARPVRAESISRRRVAALRRLSR